MFEIAGRSTFLKIDLDMIMSNYLNIKGSIGNDTGKDIYFLKDTNHNNLVFT